MLKAVLLDIDGTLIDSNDAHAWSWREALLSEGIDRTFAQIRPHIGKGGDHLLVDVAGIDSKSEIGKRISKLRARLFQEKHLPKLKVFPGVKELLQRIRQEGFRTVIATSASASDLEALVEKIGIEDLIDGSTSKDDADSSKPDPDIIEAALEVADVRPSEAVLIGDTPYDIEAAAHAGVGTLALLSGGSSEEELRGALAVYRDALDLLYNFDRSVLANRNNWRVDIPLMPV